MMELKDKNITGSGYGENWFGDINASKLEEGLFTTIGILQKYGVLITITCIIIFYLFYRLSKIRKNMGLAKLWLMTSWGMVTLTIIFIILPYIVLVFYSE